MILLEFGTMSGVRNVELSKKFGERFRNLRIAAGLSTREFADKAGIAYAQIWSIETGKGNPTIGTLNAIAEVLGVEISTLLEDL